MAKFPVFISRFASQRMVFSVACGVAVGICASTALAMPASNPGWKYGQANCGPTSPVRIIDVDDCKECCLKRWNKSLAPNAVPLHPSFLEDCYAYCGSVSWHLFP